MSSQAIRYIRFPTTSTLFSNPSQYCLGRKTRSCDHTRHNQQLNCLSSSSAPHLKDMDNKPDNPNEKTHGDVMSHSFGDGYATRSDEEGFGGIYGGNQSNPRSDDDKDIHENHPEYDRTQGSEVKEKEKGRHHTGDVNPPK